MNPMHIFAINTPGQHGRICHPIFDREWSNNTHIYQMLQHIFGMLMSLEVC